MVSLDRVHLSLPDRFKDVEDAVAIFRHLGADAALEHSGGDIGGAGRVTVRVNFLSMTAPTSHSALTAVLNMLPSMDAGLVRRASAYLDARDALETAVPEPPSGCVSKRVRM